VGRRLALLAGHLGPPAVPPAAPVATVLTLGSGMGIEKVEAMHVLRRGGTCLIFVKITTNSGLVGWGEATNSGRNQATAAAVMEGARYLYGKDPFEIERHWQHIYRGTFRRGGPILCSALAGIEMALFDIKGKALKVPVYELLGGKVREKVRCYAHLGAPGAIHLDPYTPAAERRKALESFDAAEWAKGLSVSVNGVAGVHPRDSPFSAFKVAQRCAALLRRRAAAPPRPAQAARRGPQVGIISGMEMVERPLVYKRSAQGRGARGAGGGGAVGGGGGGGVA
jgi:hypothetical protein